MKSFVIILAAMLMLLPFCGFGAQVRKISKDGTKLSALRESGMVENEIFIIVDEENLRIAEAKVLSCSEASCIFVITRRHPEKTVKMGDHLAPIFHPNHRLTFFAESTVTTGLGVGYGKKWGSNWTLSALGHLYSGQVEKIVVTGSQFGLELQKVVHQRNGTQFYTSLEAGMMRLRMNFSKLSAGESATINAMNYLWSGGVVFKPRAGFRPFIAGGVAYDTIGSEVKHHRISFGEFYYFARAGFAYEF
jgi:hypothetical protein